MICKSGNYNSFDSYDFGFETNLLEYDLKCLVIAMDIDDNKIIFAKHNAALYGVADKMKFVVGDFFVLGKTMKAVVLVYSPPWMGDRITLENERSHRLTCAAITATEKVLCVLHPV